MPPFSAAQILEEFADIQNFGYDKRARFPDFLLHRKDRMEVWFEKQRKFGRCAWCAKPHVPEHKGHKYPCCKEHKKKRHEYAARCNRERAENGRAKACQISYRAKQKAKGLCVQCRLPFLPEEKDYAKPMCRKHRDDNRKRCLLAAAKRREARVKPTLAQYASKEKRAAEWRASQRARGLCIRCTASHVPEHKGRRRPLCEKHRDLEAKRSHRAPSLDNPAP